MRTLTLVNLSRGRFSLIYVIINLLPFLSYCRIYSIVAILLGCYTFCIAQQEQQNSQFVFTKYRTNPAYAGLDYSLSVDALVRSQYTGLPGQPKTQYISAHVPAYILSGAIGIEIFRATEGSLVHNSVTGSYNYVYNLPFGFLSGGLRAGLLQTSVDGESLRTPTGDYGPNINDHKDPVLSNSTFSGFAPIWELGAYLFMGDPQFGVSISRTPTINQRLGNAEIGLVTHFDLYGQYRFRYNDELHFLQAILLKSDFNVVQTDVSLLAEINGSVFGGVGLRGYNSSSLDAISITAGLNLGRHYRLSYSYDIGLSELKRVNEGSHEILLNYNLKKMIGLGNTPKVEYNPRNL